MGANIEKPANNGPYCFRIHGQIYHRAGTLHPAIGETRNFAQLYILDAQEAMEQRMMISQNVGCDSKLMN